MTMTGNPDPERLRQAIVVVAGPTASGKSACALDLAMEFDGCVINADSMQVYQDLHVITARPSAADVARAPHSLYGMLPGREVCSAMRWAEMAAAEIAVCRMAGLLPIVCGGTGLYIRALMDGMSPIPDIPDEIRQRSRAEMDDMGNAAFHARLAEVDPVTAARLNVGDTQRLCRAWEVWEATGRSITDWQTEPNVRLIDGAFFPILIAPPRDQLYASCDRRFDLMMDSGALEEVRGLDAQALPEDAPILKALGVPELRALLHGRMDRAEAIRASKQATRNFAKRQMTWFRGQLNSREILPAQYSESSRSEIFAKVRRFLLTG